jgi:hypothetical protein
MSANRYENASWVHRVLRIQPGEAPSWLCSHDACIGISLFGLLAASIPGVSLIFFLESLMINCVALVIGGLFVLVVVEPFERCERNARALRRQREDAQRNDVASGASDE